MRIVHISTLYYPYIGGLEHAVQMVAEEQVKLGHEVSVVTSNAYGVSAGKEIINGVNVVRIKSINSSYPYLIVPRQYPKEIFERADIIHGWSQTYYFVYEMSRYGKKVLRKPLVIYFIGVDYLKKHFNPIIRTLGYQYQRAVTKRIVRLIDLAIVTNDHEQSILRGNYGLDSIILPHGVSERYINSPNMSNIFRNKYGIDGRVIAFIGRIHPTKGLDLLIRAFAEISKKEPNLTLVVAGIGDKNYLKKCMRLIKALSLENRFKYLGFISEEDKIGLIDSSELVVLPSRHAGENYSITIDEVKARGKPLVVTNYGVLPYRVVNLVEGVVVNADVHSLVKGIYYALSNIQSFRTLSRPLTWRESASRLLNFYQNVFERG